MSAAPSYVEFAVASNFSFLRGASHPEELMVQAQHLGLAGLGLCDRNSVAGVVRAHLVKREQKLALRYHPGARLVFADGTPDILAYPRDRPAWGRLCQLLTRGNLRAEKGDCILRRDDLLDFAEGLELIVMPHGTRNLSSPSPRSSRGEGRGEGDRLSARHSASETLRLAEAPPHPESADADSDLSPREVGFTRLRHDIGASRKHPTCAGRGD